MPRGVFDVPVLGIRTSRFSTTLISVEYLTTVEIYSHGHHALKNFVRLAIFLELTIVVIFAF